MAHDKLFRGRKLVVTFAHQAPPEHSGSAYGTKRRGMMEIGRPTTLSLLKTGAGTRHDGTKDKIAMMEAKLRQMESTNPQPTPISELGNTSISGSESTSEVTIASMHHPSLPLKPPPPLPEVLINKLRVTTKPKASLPVLPLLLPQSLQFRARTETRPSSHHTPARPAKQRLAGVKIGKTKDKAANSLGS
ncbi:hypothetical protein H0H92_014642 [Tricholoma furcatifolium]|nr:hypothetical protein H0H92_014642 [Tricholoma furcatifolium]